MSGLLPTGTYLPSADNFLSPSIDSNVNKNRFPIHYNLRKHAMQCQDCSTKLENLSNQVTEIANLFMRQKDIVDKADYLAPIDAYLFSKCSSDEKSCLQALSTHFEHPEQRVEWPFLYQGDNTGNFHPSLQKHHIEVECECVPALKSLSQDGLSVVNHYMEMGDMTDEIKDSESQIHYLNTIKPLSNDNFEVMKSLCPIKEFFSRVAQHRTSESQGQLKL